MRPNAPDIPFLRFQPPCEVEHDVMAVLRSGYVGAGESIASFERALQSYLGSSAVVVTSSCTAALTLAYQSAGIRPGSVVLSTPMTCAATNIPLLQLGAKVAWMDVDPLSGNVTGRTVAAALQRHPNAKALVIMDWGGAPCEYPIIMRHCRSLRIPVILDAAQSFGSTYAGSLYPEEIDYVCYSFGPTKLLSAVEGGAIAVRTSSLPDRIRSLRWYGIRREARDPWRFWDYTVEELGHRFVSNNLFAAIGLRALSQIQERLRYQRVLAGMYDSLLTGIPGLRIAPRQAESLPNFWLYTIVAQDRDDLLEKLHGEGIHAAIPHQRNDHLLSSWNSPESRETLVGVDTFARHYLCLPIGAWLQFSDIERVAAVVRSGW